jgi:hypothetical protein
VTVRTSLSRRPSDWLSTIRLCAAARRAARAAPLGHGPTMPCDVPELTHVFGAGDGEPRRQSGIPAGVHAGFRRGEAAKLFRMRGGEAEDGRAAWRVVMKKPGAEKSRPGMRRLIECTSTSLAFQ